MLKLKRVQILGFKSFCDRTDVQLSGSGIAAIVGPNGCGKSNISDAITWVLGEQSAKSLRGVKMEDVIFAGTRDRKPTGMAEVSLTLVDPDVYDASDSGEAVSISSAGNRPGEVNDWDESAERNLNAEATAAAVAEAQPGPVPPGEEAEEIEIDVPTSDTALDGDAAQNAGSPVVLKIRRRKFNRAPVRAGEITVTRRLFRSGESEYLLNGKICRLRDIQDIFFGTGLSGENYAIIGQERIGQLLSSKPLDRRSIIEEAAGITRFKTKKRLAELRLEASKQNLSRVDDIFEEVTRQMATLKRQAAKAERYGQLRDELRDKLRIVLRSRLVQKDSASSLAQAAVADLTGNIDTMAAAVEGLDAEHAEAVARGYQVDEELRGVQARINETRVELERATARMASNTDRVADLAARIAGGADERAQLSQQIDLLRADHDGLRLFLDTATADTEQARQDAQARQREASEAQSQVNNADREASQGRNQSLQLTQRISQVHREEAQAVESLAGLDRERQRLATESEQARQELEALGRQRGQVSLSFESVTDRLKRLEAEIAQHRLDLDAARRQEMETRRQGDHLRAEAATLTGRRNSLESLIRDHSYSSETVRKLFKANGVGASVAPLGTLADFLEVEDEFGAIVDEFLKDELNYIVVKDWNSADAGVGLLKGNVDGRATFLVHSDQERADPFAGGMDARSSGNLRGARPLKDCIRVLNGFGRSLEVILPKLREGFIAPDAPTARALALEHPEAFFLSPTGETFHNVTVTGGKARNGGPLALKRDLRDVQAKLETVQANLSASELGVAGLTKKIAEMQHAVEGKSTERRDAEREVANSGAALRQMDSEASRIEKRLADWSLHSERNRDARGGKQDLIEQKQAEALRLTAERDAIDGRVSDAVLRTENLRRQREEAQAAASAATAALAGLEERRRNASANFEQNERVRNTTEQRILQLDGQLASAAAERTRREEENVELTSVRETLAASREQMTADAAALSSEANALRGSIGEQNTQLRGLRAEVEQLRERRGTLQAQIARLSSEIEHLEAQSLQDLGLPAAEFRADESIAGLEEAALDAAEDETRTLKGKLEAMGPVNMMALEEFQEASQRHAFLETQRKDLLDSISNTQNAIREIDDISKLKFDEAFAVINKNFSETFVKLFGGGQATMKLTDETNSAESGIDLVASPPGKKMQNVLLLSGGEKALTALSLLVGIFEFQPSPFCILDEVDAPLDETNVGRFARLVHEMSRDTQFVVITHHKRTMSEADVIYGVTMQEPGVSKIVSVNLNRAERRAVA
ncbi:MAG: chromosome segregation protein SMC [Janthinobacterium lividum]